jgi:hypothetical protein
MGMDMVMDKHGAEKCTHNFGYNSRLKISLTCRCGDGRIRVSLGTQFAVPNVTKAASQDQRQLYNFTLAITDQPRGLVVRVSDY